MGLQEEAWIPLVPKVHRTRGGCLQSWVPDCSATEGQPVWLDNKVLSGHICLNKNNRDQNVFFLQYYSLFHCYDVRELMEPDRGFMKANISHHERSKRQSRVITLGSANTNINKTQVKKKSKNRKTIVRFLITIMASIYWEVTLDKYFYLYSSRKLLK